MATSEQIEKAFIDGYMESYKQFNTSDDLESVEIKARLAASEYKYDWRERVKAAISRGE